mmetsp:Transcript_79253/g.144604  ORF Transcript_79253/g.144604 Transcript_79253/m.144604 type:complete len:535 (+) Transcript_79253:204-1808(+)
MSRWRRGFVTSLLFPCPAPSYTIDSFPGELIWVPKGPMIDLDGDGDSLIDSVPCLLLPYESARFLIIFFHSNAEDLGRCRWFCLFLRDQFQVHVLAVEYPGYGVCPGATSREAVMANAHAALQFATQALKLPLERVKLFGRSIGTGPALALAAKFRVAGVILVTPFLSVRSLFREKVGPVALMIEEWFANEEAIKEVKSPTMIIHGRKDLLIPCRHGETLYNKCPTRKLFINPQNMDHNTNLTSDISYLIVPMFRFFALPDYSFQELKVPSWAFDKRRSPLYVRPEMQVCSHGSVPPSAGEGGYGSISVPIGDDADQPVDQEQGSEPPEDLKGRARCAQGDTPPMDYEKLTVLTHPTVLHSYQATKQRYVFQDPNSAEGSPDGGAADRGEEVPMEMIKVFRPRLSSCRQSFQIHIERRNPLGAHESATKPPGTKTQGSRGANPRAGAPLALPRGASSGTAYRSRAPSYDGEQPRAPQESPDHVPLLSDRSAEDEGSDMPDGLARPSHESSPGPRMPPLVPSEEPGPAVAGIATI